MPVEISVVSRPEDLRDIFRLRHEVFVEEEGDLAATDNGLLHDEFDAYPTTTHILVRVRGIPAATIRVTLGSSVGLPWDRLDSLSGRSDSAHSVSLLACRTAERRKRGLLVGLLRMAVRCIRADGGVEMVAAVSEKFSQTLARMGFQTLAAPEHHGAITQRITTMLGRTDAFPKPFDDHFSPDTLGGFSDAGVRLLYRKGEPVLSQGLYTARAWVVGRGSVVLGGIEGPERVCARGDTIALPELVAGRPFTGNAFAGTSGTELLPISRAAVLTGPDKDAALRALATVALREDVLVEADPAHVQKVA